MSFSFEKFVVREKTRKQEGKEREGRGRGLECMRSIGEGRSMRKRK
jgi:hypothetical protein